MMDMLKGLLSGGDGEAAVLELGPVFERLAPWLRGMVLAGPVCLLVLGLLYLFAAPKEANRRFGYRCYFGMGSVEAWQFTQRVAGMVWTALGAVLLVVMIVRCWSFGSMSGYDMAASAAWSAVWEAAAVLVSIAAINIVVMVRYDRSGDRREKK